MFCAKHWGHIDGGYSLLGIDMLLLARHVGSRVAYLRALSEALPKPISYVPVVGYDAGSRKPITLARAVFVGEEHRMGLAQPGLMPPFIL